MEERYAKISVIVPIYNVEKYLRKCLDSLVSQTYSDLEIILVNDCSTDSSLEICQEYQQKCSKIKLFSNDKNRGLSYSRNKGVKEATGSFIGFIDSDDYVPLNYYESLMNMMRKEKSDIVVCDITLVYPHYSEKRSCGNDSGERIAFINNGLAASACNKLFRKKVLLSFPFEVGKYNEDIAVILPLLVQAKSVSYNKEVSYFYVQRNTSIQNVALSEKRLDLFRALDLTFDRIKNSQKFSIYRDAILYQQLISFILYVPEREPHFQKRYSFLKKFYHYSKKYSLSKNPYLLKDLSKMGRFHHVYYRLLVSWIDKGWIFLANLLIQSKRKYQNRHSNVIKDEISMADLIALAKKQREKDVVERKVSVVVPNYNYSRYLYERIYSILYQTYKIDELILLDDCSIDESRILIDQIIKELSPYLKIRKNYSRKNGGKACIQWEKGMNMASNSYVWIAEADDYSDAHFLEQVMKGFQDEEVILSYCDTAFINQDGKKILKTVRKEIDIMKTGHWNRNYVFSGKNEFYNYTFLNCTIANVSSAVIKKGSYDQAFSIAKQYRQAGDWVFYANLMQLGKISYVAKTYNYYRVHNNNVSTVTKKEDHLKEIEQIHHYFDTVFHLNGWQKEEIEKRYRFLKKVWKIKR